MSDYEKEKKMSVTGRKTGGNPDEVRGIFPLAISHGNDQVEGEKAAILDWAYIYYVDDIHIEGEAIEDYAVQRFNSEMKTALIYVKGDFIRDGSTQFKILYGKKTSKLGAYRI